MGLWSSQYALVKYKASWEARLSAVALHTHKNYGAASMKYPPAQPQSSFLLGFPLGPHGTVPCRSCGCLACQSTLSLETLPNSSLICGFSHSESWPLGVWALSLPRELCGGGPALFPKHVPKWVRRDWWPVADFLLFDPGRASGWLFSVLRFSLDGHEESQWRVSHLLGPLLPSHGWWFGSVYSHWSFTATASALALIEASCSRHSAKCFFLFFHWILTRIGSGPNWGRENRQFAVVVHVTSVELWLRPVWPAALVSQPPQSAAYNSCLAFEVLAPRLPWFWSSRFYWFPCVETSVERWCRWSLNQSPDILVNWVAAWVSFVEQGFLVWVPNPIGRRVRGDWCRTPSPREQPSLNRRAHSVCRSLGKATLVHPRAPVVPWRPSPFSPRRSALTEHSLLTPATMAVFFLKSRK